MTQLNITISDILAFEADGGGGFGRGADQRVRNRFGLTLISYHHLLGALLKDRPTLTYALAFDATTTNRLIEKRDAAIAARRRATRT
jgi:hypothetical protein